MSATKRKHHRNGTVASGVATSSGVAPISRWQEWENRNAQVVGEACSRWLKNRGIASGMKPLKFG